MAVTFTAVRNTHTEELSGTQEFDTATLAGTYATGGFTWNPFTIPAANPGASQLMGTSVRFPPIFSSPLGYIYASTFNAAASLVTTKILTAPNTELATATAVPETTLQFILYKTKL